jgi:hypothetical protein
VCGRFSYLRPGLYCSGYYPAPERFPSDVLFSLACAAPFDFAGTGKKRCKKTHEYIVEVYPLHIGVHAG